MKKVIYPVLAFAVILIIGCTNSKKADVENPYVGAWSLVDQKYVFPDTTYVNTNKTYNVKLLTKKHYAVGHQTEENEAAAGGGEYTYDGDTFTSFPKYHHNKANLGKSVVWKSKIEGDLWKISRSIKNDTLQVDYTETWKRIPE